jgi:hypothetical protein
MRSDLYIWERPRDLDAEQALALVEGWEGEGGDPAASPFEPTTNMGWFFRELHEELPDLEARTDAIPRRTRVPVWASGTDEAPARVVALRLDPESARPVVESVYGLATKYDLLVLEPRRPSLHRPLERLTEVAHATFWPGGAIRSLAFLVGGAILAAVAYAMGIPIVSGALILLGLFFVVLCAFTLGSETRHWYRTRGSPPG